MNEGLGLGASDATPYDLVSSMMEDFACTEILDPRFRDAGVGVDLGKLDGAIGGRGIHVVVEFGLKRGAKPPSSKTKPAKTCSHRLPRPPTSPVVPAGAPPTVHSEDITITLRCVAEKACTFDADLKLAHRGTVSHGHVDALAPDATNDVVFPFAADDLKAEKDADHPGVDLTLTSTGPFAFEDVFSVGI